MEKEFLCVIVNPNILKLILITRYKDGRFYELDNGFIGCFYNYKL